MKIKASTVKKINVNKRIDEIFDDLIENGATEYRSVDFTNKKVVPVNKKTANKLRHDLKNAPDDIKTILSKIMRHS